MGALHPCREGACYPASRSRLPAPGSRCALLEDGISHDDDDAESSSTCSQGLTSCCSTATPPGPPHPLHRCGHSAARPLAPRQRPLLSFGPFSPVPRPLLHTQTSEGRLTRVSWKWWQSLTQAETSQLVSTGSPSDPLLETVSSLKFGGRCKRFKNLKDSWESLIYHLPVTYLSSIYLSCIYHPSIHLVTQEEISTLHVSPWRRGRR